MFGRGGQGGVRVRVGTARLIALQIAFLIVSSVLTLVSHVPAADSSTEWLKCLQF